MGKHLDQIRNGADAERIEQLEHELEEIRARFETVREDAQTEAQKEMRDEMVKLLDRVYQGTGWRWTKAEPWASIWEELR